MKVHVKVYEELKDMKTIQVLLNWQVENELAAWRYGMPLPEALVHTEGRRYYVVRTF